MEHRNQVLNDIADAIVEHREIDWDTLGGLKINDKEFYNPFYLKAVVHKVRQEYYKREFINIYLKGGRYSGKTYVIANLILELSYKDCRMSTIIIAETVEDHKERGVKLFDNILAENGMSGEWTWKTKASKPKLIRSTNGYLQEIQFISIADAEKAGGERPINEATGLAGFIGFIWADEMAKKTDNVPDADFTKVNRFLDAVQTIKNTIIRHMRADEEMGAIITAYTLNPWGKENPIVKEFHSLLPDNHEKLISHGYNLAYEDDLETFKICATTNYRVNPKLDRKTRRTIRSNRKSQRAATIIDGVTGGMLNADFERELNMMKGLNRAGNIPKDTDFIPMNMSMDVGTGSSTMLYLNGYDGRFMVKGGGKYYPTRIITKGEFHIDSHKDLRDIPSKIESILKHIHGLSQRFPTMLKGFNLFVDGSAVEFMELMRNGAKDLNHQHPTYNFDWLNIIPQNSKWSHNERREKRRVRFTDMIGSYGLIVDMHECPDFYDMTGKIVGKRNEQKFDHAYDALMYGLMSIYGEWKEGMRLKSVIGKRNNGIIQE